MTQWVLIAVKLHKKRESKRPLPLSVFDTR